MRSNFIDESIRTRSIDTLLTEAFDDSDFSTAISKVVKLSTAIEQYPELESLNQSLRDVKKKSLQAKKKWGVGNWLDLPWGRRKTLAKYSSSLDSLRNTLIKGIRSLKRTLDAYSDLDKSVELNDALMDLDDGDEIRSSFESEIRDSNQVFQLIGKYLGSEDLFKDVISGNALSEDLFKLSYSQLVSLGHDIVKGTATRKDSPREDSDFPEASDNESPETEDSEDEVEDQDHDDPAGQDEPDEQDEQPDEDNPGSSEDSEDSPASGEDEPEPESDENPADGPSDDGQDSDTEAPPDAPPRQSAQDLAGEIVDYMTKNSADAKEKAEQTGTTADAVLRDLVSDFLKSKGIAESTLKALKSPALLTLFEFSGGSRKKLHNTLLKKNVIITESRAKFLEEGNETLDRWRKLAGISEEK